MRRLSPSVSHEKMQIREFRRRPELAFGYLDEAFALAFKDDDPAFALMALSDVVKALGVSRVARQTGLKRESLHRMLSKRGNPEWNSLFRVLKALGLRPRFERLEPVRTPAARQRAASQ